MSATCMKCGSEKLIPLVGMMDQGQYSDGHLKAFVAYTNPDSWLFKGPVYAKMAATICGECGFTELTADDPAGLYQAYLDYQDKVGEPKE